MQIFYQGIENAKKKAVEDYIASLRFDDLMMDSYRRGFKLSWWMIRNTYPDLDVSAISTLRITQEMANAADGELDSEGEAGPSGVVEVPFDGEEVALGM